MKLHNNFVIRIKDFKKWGGALFLTLIVSATYLPFLGFRVLRMAGDEKVYVSQSIEMARAGRWFVQTLADVPDYYKGPLHYLLVRIGMSIFRPHLFSALYMNWLLALAGALAFYFMALRKPVTNSSALLLGAASALNVGVFTHAFASQMEVELCAVYTLAIAALGWPAEAQRSKVRNFSAYFMRDILFWIAAGAAGAIKSPLHSGLIGAGGLFFWALRGELLQRVVSPGAWGAALSGVMAALIGYAPAYIFDKKNLVEIFLGRENLQKPNNGRYW